MPGLIHPFASPSFSLKGCALFLAAFLAFAPAAWAQDPSTAPEAGTQDPSTTPAAGTQDPSSAPAAGAQDPSTTPAAGAQDPSTAPAAAPQDPSLTPGYESTSIAVAGEAELTLSWLIRRCVDLERLSRFEEGVACKQFSSYDHSAPDANRDWDNYLRESLEEGKVCAEMEGPGCINRIWSANPSGTIFFYLDGAEEPALALDTAELFSGERYPFLDPLAYRVSGADSYLPIPFMKSCKVTVRDNDPMYYHVGYTAFPPETSVESYSEAGAEAARPTLERALEILSRPGPDLVNFFYGGELETVPVDSLIMPDEPAELIISEGAGRVALLQLKGSSTEHDFLRKILLEIYWDGDRQPAVRCPLGDFFGTSFGANDYCALPMGMTVKGGYCLFPMPFEKGARMVIRNQGSLPVAVQGRVVIAPLDEDEPHLRFHAGWRRENPCTTFDYPVLQARGKGIFVGCALYIDNPRVHWWGEGDEKIRVDGEEVPSIYGTGTEDYFGDAWGHRVHVKPFQGCTLQEGPQHGNKTCVYRFHVADSVPFSKSFNMTIENYAEDVDYASVAWWYQEPGGEDFFTDTPVARRLSARLRAMGAVEAESLTPASEEMEIFVTDDSNLLYELSGGKGLFLKGHGAFPVTLNVEEGGSYTVSMGLARGLKHPALSLSAPEGVAVYAEGIPPGTPETFLGTRAAGRVKLEAGDNLLFIHVEKDLLGEVERTILDFLILEPMGKRADALELEEMEIMGVERGIAATEDILPDCSGGSRIRFTARDDDAVMNIKLPIHTDGVYTITGYCARTFGYGIFAVAVDGQSLGNVNPVDLEGDTLGRFEVGPVRLAADDHILTIGTDTSVGLDCIVLSWQLSEHHLVEGEALKVIDLSRGKHEIQNLEKTHFSQGKHLWFKGTEEGAFMEVELPVAKTDYYHLVIHYTTSWDYGTVKVFLDGEPVGDEFNAYCPRVVPSGPVDYGEIHLEEGVSQLKFLIIGKDDFSKGYYLGVDGVILAPAGE